MRLTKFRFISLFASLAILLGQISGQDVPHSIIFIIADGAGVGQHTLSYYLNDRYSPAAFEHVGLVATHPSQRNKVTDSAAGATSLATGVKTYNGAIAVDDDRQPVKTVLEYAQDMDMVTGLVATSTITHATPAAFAAHVESRGEYGEIARQMAKAGVTVLFGGGRKHFLPEAQGGLQETDLLVAMSARGVQVVASLEDRIESGQQAVGLFADEALPPANKGRQPTTAAMAVRALDILDDDPDGFFLMVEESQVDWGSHDHDFDYVKAEMASLNDLVDALLDYQKEHPEVLVVLVADHETGGLAIQNKVVGDGLKDAWTTKSHSGNLVPIFATGPGSEAFDAVVDNTFIGNALIEYVNAR